MSVNIVGVRAAILAKVAEYSDTPIVYPGNKYVPEAGDTNFVRIALEFNDVVPLSLGYERLKGFVAAGVFGRLNDGTDEVTAFAATFRALFPKGLSLPVSGGGKAQFFTTTLRPLVYEADKVWFHQPVICSFYSDATI